MQFKGLKRIALVNKLWEMAQILQRLILKLLCTLNLVRPSQRRYESRRGIIGK